MKKYLHLLKTFLLFSADTCSFKFVRENSRRTQYGQPPHYQLIDYSSFLIKGMLVPLLIKEIALVGICYFLLAVAELCTGKKLKLAAISGPQRQLFQENKHIAASKIMYKFLSRICKTESILLGGGEGRKEETKKKKKTVENSMRNCFLPLLKHLGFIVEF